MLLLACLLAAAAAAPSYDQRQDGDFNVRADVQNVVVLLAYPSKLSIPPGLFEGLVKSVAPEKSSAQDRADVRVMEAFVEPSTPYHVEIGESGREADGRAVEVVIAARRRSGAEPQPEEDRDELKLLGATEQCGPGRERDPATLMCRDSAPAAEEAAPDAGADIPVAPEAPVSQNVPEVVPVASS